MTNPFAQAPGWTVVFGFACLVTGVALLLMLVWHMVRRVADVPRVPLGGGTYTFLALACLLLVSTGAMALLVSAGLVDWTPRPAAPTAIAEMTCRPEGKGRVRLGLVRVRADGQRAGEEWQHVDGNECPIVGELLEFPAPIARAGLGGRYRLARVGTRPDPVVTPPWRALPAPAGVPVATVNVQEVKAVADRGTAHRLLVDAGGLRLEPIAP